MSDTIKRSLWEKLKYLDSVNFQVIPKGYELDWTLKENVSKDLDLGDLEDDLSDYFLHHLEDFPHEFGYHGELSFDQTDPYSATYNYEIDVEIGEDLDLSKRVMDLVLLDIEKLNKREFDEHQLLLNFCSENGEVTECEIELDTSSGAGETEIKLNDTIKQKIAKEVRAIVKEKFEDSGNRETVGIYASDINEITELGELDIYFEIVEDADW
jgi:hypothetical protein